MRRQFGWFTDLMARLEHIAERRNVVLFCLYIITGVLAVSKHILFLYGWRGNAYLMPILLIVTGMSAAMTAYYINQNSRSLIHRYNTQQRFITNWMDNFNETWKFSDLSSLALDPGAKDKIRSCDSHFRRHDDPGAYRLELTLLATMSSSLRRECL